LTTGTMEMEEVFCVIRFTNVLRNMTVTAHIFTNSKLVQLNVALALVWYIVQSHA